MPHLTDQFQAGQRVTVTQQIPQRDEVWTTRVRGEVVKYEQKKTGSWFAHAKDDKLWLDRLTIRKDDGEVVVFNLDGYTHIEMVETAAVDETDVTDVTDETADTPEPGEIVDAEESERRASDPPS